MTKAFYSFHFSNDVVRASQVRNIGAVDGDQVVDDNSWEKVKKGGDAGIETWIQNQMKTCDVVIVLVGAETASRKWINYEICRAWDTYKPIVGIRIHGLKNFQGQTSSAGLNPFDGIPLTGGAKLSQFVPLHSPVGTDSKAVYQNISDNIKAWIRGAGKRAAS